MLIIFKITVIRPQDETNVWDFPGIPAGLAELPICCYYNRKVTKGIIGQECKEKIGKYVLEWIKYAKINR